MNIGKTFIFIGLMFIAMGIIFLFFKNNFSWFGKLIGDISYKNDNFSFYMPLASMLLLSAVVSVLINLIYRFFGK